MCNFDAKKVRPSPETELPAPPVGANEEMEREIGLAGYVKERDHFHYEPDLFSRLLGFPCCVCSHSQLNDNEFPCRVCGHNANGSDPFERSNEQ